jgi:L-lysine 2,3-aminomutase
MEQMMIYGLYCPNTNKPVYVGQSKVGLDRPFAHINEKSHSDKVNEWVKFLKKDGQSPVLVILEQNFPNKYTNDKELFWINKFINDGNVLLNQAGIKPYYFYHTQLKEENEDDYLLELRNFVKTRRKMLKLSQKQLAEKSGLGLRFIREFEQGTKTNFQTDSIYQLCKMFGRNKMSITFVVDN